MILISTQCHRSVFVSSFLSFSSPVFPSDFRAHILQGLYSIEDLDGLVGSKVPSMNPPTFWDVSKCKGVRIYACACGCGQQEDNYLLLHENGHCCPGPVHWSRPHSLLQPACAQWLHPHRRPCMYLPQVPETKRKGV